MTLRSSCSSSLTRAIITFVVARTLPGLPFLLLLLLGSAVPLRAAPAAPGFTVRLLGSQRAFDSRELIGKKVLVVRFQASWCKPCAKESAALTRLAERYRARGVAAHARSLVARHDRHPCQGERPVERVLAGPLEDLRLEGHERLRDAAGDHHDVRVQAVHDGAEHRAEGTARLVDDGRGRGVALPRRAKDEGCRDRERVAAGRREQGRTREAGEARARRLGDAPAARVEGETAAAAAPARRPV